jgi:hypothetical protein
VLLPFFLFQQVLVLCCFLSFCSSKCLFYVTSFLFVPTNIKSVASCYFLFPCSSKCL